MTDQGIPDAVTAAWDQAVAAWDDPAKHDALLAAVAAYSCYAWAAAQYKPRAGDPIADKALERLRKAATASLLATAMSRPAAPERMPYRSSLVVLLVLVIMIGVGVAYAVSRTHRGDSATTTDVPH